MMKNYLLFLFSLVLFSINANGQCAECPVGSVIITGTTDMNDQNNANDYCITGDWTGNLGNIADGSTITVCPTATWNMQSNVAPQKNIEISNYGTITDNGNGYEFKVQGQASLTNTSSGVMDIGIFENQDAQFVNEGSLTAEDIYLHGITSNSGTMTSTADCSGDATTNCGFYIGNKSAPFNNTGIVNAVDADIKDGIIGGGMFNVTGNTEIFNNSAPTDNVFSVNDLSLQSSGNYSLGSFTVAGVLDCNNSNITADICFTPTGTYGSSCSNATAPIIQCSLLPVEIVSFTAKEADDAYIFNWEIAAEINVSHYEILYSLDGREYLPYGELRADNSTYYQWKGEKIVGSIVYFKLKNVDLDGSFSIYEKAILIEPRTSLEFNVSPNPVPKDGFFNISFDTEEDVLISLYDMNGQNLVSKYYNDSKSITFDVSSIEKSGLYVLQISTSTKSRTEEIYIY